MVCHGGHVGTTLMPYAWVRSKRNIAALTGAWLWTGAERIASSLVFLLLEPAVNAQNGPQRDAATKHWHSSHMRGRELLIWMRQNVWERSHSLPAFCS